MLESGRAPRFIVVILVGCLVTLPEPGASQSPEDRADLDVLLQTHEVDETLTALSDAFLTHFLMLAPNLPAEDQEILRGAVRTAFAPDSLRKSLAATLAETTTDEDTGLLVESYRAGALAELRDVASAHEPTGSLQEFGRDLATLDSDRLGLMVGLVEAMRASDLALSVDEALRQVAYDVFADLGGSAGDVPGMTDEQYAAAYRNRTISLGVESMYRLEPAPSELVRAAMADHGDDGARRYSEQYVEAMLGAIDAAGADLGSLITGEEPEPASDPRADVDTIDPAEAPPCRVLTCGFLVDWSGPEPIGGSLAYRAPGDFERFAFETLVGAGYRLVRELHGSGLTIQLRPSPQNVQCEVVSGTNPRICRGVGDVRIELIGEYPGFDGDTSFIVRNRCRANQVMSADGIARLVAARIDYELTTFDGDERREPRC